MSVGHGDLPENGRRVLKVFTWRLTANMPMGCDEGVANMHLRVAPAAEYLVPSYTCRVCQDYLALHQSNKRSCTGAMHDDAERRELNLDMLSGSRDQKEP